MLNTYPYFYSPDDLGGHATLLLNMVRRRSKENQEKFSEKTLNLPRDDDVETDE